MVDSLSVDRPDLAPAALAGAGLLPTIRMVLASTCRTASLTTLELQVAGIPGLSVLVRGPARRGLRLLTAWPVTVAPDSLHGGLLLVATAPDGDPPRRVAVSEAALLVGELIVADQRRTRAESMASQAIELAGVDALTELGNRRTWRRALDLEATRALRYSGASSVVIVDLDGLKRINDEHGHAAGDLHLQRASAGVRAASRTVDVVCRLGGDEFGVLAPSTDDEGADRLAARLREELMRAGVQASLGVATTVSGDLDEAWQRADAAMYAQKRDRSTRG